MAVSRIQRLFSLLSGAICHQDDPNLLTRNGLSSPIDVVIEENSDKMHAMAKALLEWETIDTEQLDDIMAGRTPREPRDWEGGSGTSGAPPVVQNERPETPIGGPAADV